MSKNLSSAKNPCDPVVRGRTWEIPLAEETIRRSLRVYENPNDPGWRAEFQKAADTKCNGRALVSDEPLRFTSSVNGRPPFMSGLYTCR